eukprot:4573471-Pleurochrysis_carterae.AAC.2
MNLATGCSSLWDEFRTWTDRLARAFQQCFAKSLQFRFVLAKAKGVLKSEKRRRWHASGVFSKQS